MPHGHVFEGQAEPPLPVVAGLTTIQAAKQLGMSVPWIKLHAADLGGVLTRAGYRFPAEITLERVSEKITLSQSRSQAIPDKEKRYGELARKVFAALDLNKPTREIVIELGEPPAKILAIAKEWIDCGRFDGTTLAVIHGQKQPAVEALPVSPVVEMSLDLSPNPQAAEPVDSPKSEKRPSMVAEMVADARRRAAEMGLPPETPP